MRMPLEMGVARHVKFIDIEVKVQIVGKSSPKRGQHPILLDKYGKILVLKWGCCSFLIFQIIIAG